MAGVFTQGRVEGQLGAAKATLLTAGGIAVLVKTITLVNTDSSARTVNIYFKNATSRRVIPKDYSLAIGAQLQLEFNGVLIAGDLIEGDASAASVVDFWVSYITES